MSQPTTNLPTSAQIEHLIRLLTAVQEKAQTSDMRASIENFVTMLEEATASMDRVAGDLSEILPAVRATERLEARMDQMEGLITRMDARLTAIHGAMMAPVDPVSPHGGS